MLESLRTGRPLVEALVAQTRAQLARGEGHAANSIATSLRTQGGTETIGSLAGAIVAFQRGFVDLAWSYFEPLSKELWAPYAADEYVRAGLLVDPEVVRFRLRALVDEPPDYVSAENWMAMLGPVFGYGDQSLARDIYSLADRLVGDGAGVEESLVVNRDWMRRWVAATGDSRSGPPAPDGHISFAIMDYGHPGRARASANIGDHVQSLASLGHLARHQDLKYSGSQHLVDLLQQLRSRVRPETQRHGVDGSLELLTVDRDASMYKEVPPDTWTLAFGWFMHAIFDMRFGFPFHRNLLPIFLSFHCNKRDLLTPEAIDHLRRFGPIGCRDWTTVDILLSVEVPAFFSGCMTTTVGTVFPDLQVGPAAGAPVAYVDVAPEKVPASAPTYKHSSDAIRFRSFATNVYDAIDLLETYRREHSGLVTSRLHCYLPGRAMGVPVDFQPRNRSDIRFAGLIDITDEEFDRIRNGINTKLEQVLGAVFSGQDPEAVYALWRQVTAEDVEAAKQRRAASPPLPTAKSDISAQVARVVAATAGDAGSRPDAPETIHVAAHVAKGQRQQLAVMLASLAAHTSRPLHVWLVTRAPRAVDTDELRELLPGLSISVVPTRGLGSDLRRADGRAALAHDIDLLALSDLLPGVDRVLVLPCDALICDDLAELGDLDLAGNLFAAPTVVGTRSTSGFGLLHAAGNRLAGKTVAAAELRRRGHARHAFDFDAFDTAVLVMDLSACRARSLVDSYVPFVEEFGLTFREILLFEAGPHRQVVPPRWYVVPTRCAVSSPGLIHWAEGGNPWSEGVVPEQARWREAALSVERSAVSSGRRFGAANVTNSPNP